VANLSDGAIKVIVRLIDGDVISGGDFNKHKKYLEPLVDEKIITHKQISKKRFEIKANNSDNLQNYITGKYGIESLENYLQLDENSTRFEVLETTKNDKAKKVNTLSGLYISSQDNIKIFINSNEVVLNTPKGTSTFLPISANLDVDNDILIVGIENAECLHYISKVNHLFPKREKLYMYRNKYMLEWLQEHNNEYLHFGDFDLAGIQIYKNQIVPKLSNKSSFFIPENIEELLNKGASDLFLEHHKFKKNLLGFSKETDYLIELIYNYKKTVRQESLFSE